MSMSITVSFVSTKSSSTSRTKRKREARNEFGILSPPSHPTRTKRTSRRRPPPPLSSSPVAVRRSQRRQSPRRTPSGLVLPSSSQNSVLSSHDVEKEAIADEDRASFLVWSATPAARLIARCRDVMYGLRKGHKPTDGMGTFSLLCIGHPGRFLTSPCF
jgi:hypothetical protein